MNKAQVINKLVDKQGVLIGYGLYGGDYTVYVSKEKFNTLDCIEDKDIVQYLELAPVQVAKVFHEGVNYVVDIAHKLFVDEEMKDFPKLVSKKDNTVTIFGDVFHANNLIPLDSDYAIKRMLSNVEY